MKINFQKAALAVGISAAVMGASAMAASPVSYSYGEVGYQSITVNDTLGKCWNDCYGSQEDKGLAVAASYEVVPHVFVRGSWDKTRDKANKLYSSNPDTEVGGWSETTLGAGYAQDVSATSSAYVALDAVRSSWEWSYRDATTPEDRYHNGAHTIAALSVGSRTKVTDALEFDASAGMGGDSYKKLEAALITHVTPNVSIKASYATESIDLKNVVEKYNNGNSFRTRGTNQTDLTIFTLAARYNF